VNKNKFASEMQRPGLRRGHEFVLNNAFRMWGWNPGY
jgi:hypothetical protein